MEQNYATVTLCIADSAGVRGQNRELRNDSFQLCCGQSQDSFDSILYSLLNTRFTVWVYAAASPSSPCRHALDTSPSQHIVTLQRE